MNKARDLAEQPWWKQMLVGLFAIDPRSLAAFRIGIALVVLYDLIDRMYDFEAMVLDRGIMPVADARTHEGWWSLYFLSSADWFQTLLFGLTVGACVMMMLGCFTRVATICTWVLILSLQARMPIILNGGDSWVRVMLFWAMFLPLGKVWSIDARRAGRRLADAVRNPVLSFATAAALLQIGVVYFFAGLAKWNEVWLSGEAMYYVFDQLIFLRPLGKQLLNYPAILHALSYSTLAFEILAPLVVFIPWATRRIRVLMVLLVFGFHVGIELTLNVGHFSYVAAAAWMLFLPAMFWDSRQLAKILPSRRGRKKRKSKAAQTQAVRSVSLVWAKRAVVVFCAGCLAFVLAWNVSWIIEDDTAESFRDATEPFGETVRLTQRWRMFGIPYSGDVWYVYRARLRDGSIVDLIRNGDPPSDQRPEANATFFWNHRWKKMHNTMAMTSTDDPERLKRLDRDRHLIAGYISRKWNEQHGPDKQIVKLQVLCYGTTIGPRAEPGEFSRTTFATLEFGEPEETSVFQDLQAESDEEDFSVLY